MENTVFNSYLELYCHRYMSKTAPVPAGAEYDPRWQRAKMIALLFEQFMLFDKVAIMIDRTGMSLVFLIRELGINAVEELLDKKIIELVLWIPLIFTTKGKPEADGSFDEAKILGTPPLVPATYVESDLDPNISLNHALSWFQLNNDRKKIFKRIASKCYVYPATTADYAVQLTINAYQSNYLSSLGLKYEKEPEQLGFDDRTKLSLLSHDVLETSILGELGYSSYEKYSYQSLANESIKSIESGLKVSNNTSEILAIENLPNLQALVFDGTFKLNDALILRNRNVVTSYRQWINTLSKAGDYEKISQEYINELAGKNKFAESTSGKLLRTFGMFGVGAGIGALFAGPLGGFVGAGIGKVAELGLGLFDTFTLDSILKGWNPKMFVEEIRQAKDKSS
jgi:hypothetical protein